MFNVPYKLFWKRTNIEETTATWRIEYYKADENNISSELSDNGNVQEREFYREYLPRLNIDGALTPAPLYLQNLEYFPVVIASVGGIDVWK
jgi:hypothetical protein